jgi:hypothetical protein
VLYANNLFNYIRLYRILRRLNVGTTGIARIIYAEYLKEYKVCKDTYDLTYNYRSIIIVRDIVSIL